MGENNKIRIALDAMGGNFAPANEIEGAILAYKEKPDILDITLVGDGKLIEQHLRKYGFSNSFNILNAEDIVTMEDSPSDSYKNKPKSSMRIGLELQSKGESDAFVSTGNTGAVLANSTLSLGKIEGISRPTIGSPLPSLKGGFSMLFDVGASVDCKSRHLLEFAVMGSVYMNYIGNIPNPRVGLLNIGEEENKGNEVTIKAYDILKNSKINFIGNVEGDDILCGKVDVTVCDGYTGNIILKFAESVIEILKYKFKEYASRNVKNKIWMGLFRNTLKKILKEFDYQNYGGVPLLGVNGVAIIGHGKSTSVAIKNMIFRAVEMVKKNVNEKIKTEINSYLNNNNK